MGKVCGASRAVKRPRQTSRDTTPQQGPFAQRCPSSLAIAVRALPYRRRPSSFSGHGVVAARSPCSSCGVCVTTYSKSKLLTCLACAFVALYDAPAFAENLILAQTLLLWPGGDSLRFC